MPARRPKVTLTCPYCGKHRDVSPGRAKTHKGFCDLNCATNAHRTGKPVPCLECGQPINVRPCESYKKFCSKPCRSAYLLRKHSAVCLLCNQSFYKPPSSRQVYCSRTCFRKSTINFHKSEQYILQKLDQALSAPNTRLCEHTWPWLVNPTTSYHLHVDAFYPGINLAVEYNGSYHYGSKPGFDGRYSLAQRQTLDDLKLSLLRAHGLQVLVIKYDEPKTVVHLRDRLSQLGIH
jgi:hypothetical protein